MTLKNTLLHIYGVRSIYNIVNVCINTFQAKEENGIWSLVIRKVGHNDAGTYECQTNSEIKGSVNVKLDIKGTFSFRCILLHVTYIFMKICIEIVR